jgi:hypothetical protein
MRINVSGIEIGAKVELESGDWRARPSEVIQEGVQVHVEGYMKGVERDTEWRDLGMDLAACMI